MNPLSTPRPFATVLLFPLLCALSAPAPAADDLAALYGDEPELLLATGTAKPLSRAPAVATVITADDIEAMGANELDEVLESVPGLHVSAHPIAYNALYQIRGIASEFNPQVLMMVNGFPITSIFHGDRGNVWGGMPVAAIQRIEVVRGPGSALYGADAFSGVINIVTKGPDDLHGSEARAGIGSDGIRRVSLLHGGRIGGVRAAFILEADTTDGADPWIAADAQSGLDTTFGTSASLAPGPVNRQRERLDLRLDLAKGPWRLRGAYEGRANMGTGGGVAQALDPAGEVNRDRLTADLTWNREVAPQWDVTVEAAFHRYRQWTDLILYPAGTRFAASLFPDGMIGNPDVAERHLRLQASAVHTGIADHRVRLGVGLFGDEIYQTREGKNFVIDPLTGLPVYTGAVVDVDDTPRVFLPEESRHGAFAYLQDEWQFAPDWELTAGMRYDHYSDVGGTLNPRLALVWATHYALTTKLLYGRAFRAPSFAELYNQANPVYFGNPALKPETIDTLELSFVYHPAASWSGTLSTYRYAMRDIIRTVPDPAPATSVTERNAGSQDGYGMELEGRWAASDTLDLSANYAWQHAEDTQRDSAVGLAPQHQLYLRADWRITPRWRLDGRVNRVSDRARPPGDSRPATDDYTLTSLALHYREPHAKWGAHLTVDNLFDERALEPTPPSGLIPGDLPLAGRTLYASIDYRF
ncbi:TonB-dependent receptor plug domain-containing protein [Endothiovibrio diazotrophicus]